MKNIDLFALIFHQTHMKPFLWSFLAVYLICCTGIWLIDPSIPTFGDALWFGFMIATTVGFGDFTVVTPIARGMSVILGLYGILVIGFICGIGTSWFMEKIRMGRQESVSQMLWQLEHLDALSDDQLKTIAKKAQSAAVSDSGKTEHVQE